MANVAKCDGCGRFFEVLPDNKSFEHRDAGPGFRGPVRLCPTCWADAQSLGAPSPPTTPGTEEQDGTSDAPPLEDS